MKICWVGTSYFSMGEKVDDRGTEIDFVKYIAERHHTHEHLNLSIPGMGFNYTPTRIEYGIEQDCTHFILELPNGLRQNFISEMSKSEPHRKYLRVHEYKNGVRTFEREHKRQFYLDSFLAGCDDHKLRTLMLHSDFPFMHDSNFWDMVRKFSLMIDEKFKRCEWIHNALNVQTRLESEGKKVIFYEWDMGSTTKKGATQDSIHGKQLFTQCCVGADNCYKKLNLMSDPWPLTIKWAVQDGYLTQQQIDATISPNSKETDPQEIEFATKKKEWEDKNYYDGSHLNDEALRKYSSTFDQVIWDWENGK